MNNNYNNLGHNDFHHSSLNSNKEYIPKYTSNNQYNYNNDYQNINYNQGYNTFIPVKKRSSLDKLGLACSIFNIYYLFSLCSIYFSYGLENFIKENFDKPEYKEILENNFAFSLSINWIVFLISILGIIFGICGRKKEKNKMNMYNIISNSITLVLGIASFIYVFNKLK